MTLSLNSPRHLHLPIETWGLLIECQLVSIKHPYKHLHQALAKFWGEDDEYDPFPPSSISYRSFVALFVGVVFIPSLV